MDKRNVCYRRPGLSLVAICLLLAMLPLADASAKSKSKHKSSTTVSAASSKTGSHTKKKGHSAKSGSSEKTASSQGGRHKRKGKAGEGSDVAGKTRGSKEKTSSRGKSKHAGKETASDDYYEPKAMPANYEADTRLLAKSYQLRDQALNEQMRGDFGDAVKHLSDAVEISAEYYQGNAAPSEAQLYFELAVAAESAGQNDLARKSYEDCLSRNPKLADVRVKMATLLAKMGESDQAIIEARRAAATDTSDPRPHHLLGILLERKGDFAAAEDEKSKTKALLGAKPVPKPEPQKPEAAPESSKEEGESGEAEPADIPPADMPLGLP